MKKIALILAVVLLAQFIPSKSQASYGPSPTSPAILLGAAVAGYFLLFDAAPAKPTAKATGNEFQDLNNNPAFKNLLNQAAGGSLNTLEILK